MIGRGATKSHKKSDGERSRDVAIRRLSSWMADRDSRTATPSMVTVSLDGRSRYPSSE